MPTWTPWALPGISSALVGLALAAFVWRTARDATVRRRFSLLLLAEGGIGGTGLIGPLNLLHDPAAFALGWKIHLLNDCLVLGVYLPAVASVVRSPLLRPFEHGLGRALVAALALTYAALVLFAPAEWVSTVGKGWPGYGSPHFPVLGPVVVAIFLSLFGSYVLGLVGTAIAWRRASPGVGRRKAGVLTLAFGTRDVTSGVLYLFPAASLLLGVDPFAPEMEGPGLANAFFAYGGTIVYFVLAGYAIAVYNVIDVDLRLKRGLKQSTVAAAFVALFFVVSEGTAALLSETLGTLAAIAATGVLLFFLSPLQELAGRLANQAMPGVRDSPEYRQFRKLQIYGEAVREALSGGEIDAVRRVALNGLREELALSAEAASAMEAELSGAHAR